MKIEQEIKHGNAMQHYLADGNHIYCVALHDDGNISVRRTTVKTKPPSGQSIAKIINSRKSTWIFDTR